MNRIDLMLTERGIVKSRAQAQALIKQGKVSYLESGKWQVASKPSLKIPTDTELTVAFTNEDKYVSRGALKLAGALEQSGIDFTGKIILDVGQSTGGFTDCALQYGARKVVGIEVGHNQLAEQLREDSRVVCFEGMNARTLTAEDLGEHMPEYGFDAVVMDVSFISQTKILPQLPALMASGAYLITLVKPQFELGKEAIGKGGIVKDTFKIKALEQEMKDFVSELGLTIIAYNASQITGGDGNQEYLLIAQKH
ncbi:TlyA family RNA methyltransferase [Maribrevibacterium harenarium]|uniref:TlyA family RNA methyltransferase n=1 Tax=Maribrevibacterium harenarium TaxID=2589817 RepID=A0A501X2F2_9GAMM|nr:TlyA family RNA methyltransferase [Maribrevibacterium harenarium]TPE54658.1 TlyA family RNA methyltransferase [Maribrevibacterium harenarium]